MARLLATAGLQLAAVMMARTKIKIGIFACPDTDSFSARCQNREGHSPLAIHTAAFVHVLVLLAAGFALCFGESINLT
jgi:hypothetical protein